MGNIAVGFADNIMVGRHTTEELAAASFVNNFFNMAILACMGFTYGLTPLIGALYSSGQKKGVGTYLRVGLWVNIVFTLLLCSIMLGLYYCLAGMGQPEELLPLIRPYYLIVLAGLPAICVFNVFSQWCFGIGDTVTPTVVMLAGNLINVGGNYILIYGAFGAPELGLVGAGISTLAARILVMAALAYLFLRGRRGRPYRDGFYRAAAEDGTAAKVARTGFPVSMQMLFETAAFSGAAVIAGWVGKIPLAALQIIIVMGMFGFCIYYSIGGATAIVMSHAAGRSDNAAMRGIAADGYVLTLISMVCAIAIFLFCSRQIIGWFTEDAAVIAAASSVIFPLVVYQLGDATQITFANALRATTHVTPMLYTAFVCYIMLGLPATYMLAIPAGLGLYGIVMSFSLSLFMAGALYFVFFLKSTRSTELRTGGSKPA